LVLRVAVTGVARLQHRSPMEQLDCVRFRLSRKRASPENAAILIAVEGP